MLYGNLIKKQNDWYVKTDDTELLVNKEHSMWLLIHGYENLKVCYEIETIKTSESETTTLNVARLKACFPDTHEYTQD